MILQCVQVARAASELEHTVNTYKQYQDTQQQLDAAKVYLKSEEAASDPDMAGEAVPAEPSCIWHR